MATKVQFETGDTILNAEWVDDSVGGAVGTSGLWKITCKDLLTQREANGYLWTTLALGAVLFLMAGTGEEESTDPELTALMYDIVEKGHCFNGWPIGVIRPIP